MTFAESCTGGWIAKVITDIPGSSAYFKLGFVTYSNQTKLDILGVSKTSIDRYGAVSEQVVIEMAKRALAIANADFAVSVSGIASPSPDSCTYLKKVGTVWFCFASQSPTRTIDKIVTRCCLFKGERMNIRRQAVIYSLTTLLKEIIKN